MRAIVDLTPPVIEVLKAMCARYNISRAEAIRRAVLAQQQQEKEANTGALPCFGMWKDRDIDGLEYQLNLRSEWDRDFGN